MEIITLSNHIVRKALNLSLNEMAILCDIKKMSQNPSFGYWCIKSKDKIADWLDLSRTTVFSGINTLIKKGLIERSEFGLRPSKVIYMLDMAQEDIGLLIKNNDIELITKKIQEVVDGQ
jgi:predicted transcriptional regulator